MAEPQRCLSVRQPFVELILRGDKRLELRSRRTNIRERVWLYASLTLVDDASFTRDELEALPRGLIVGTAEIVDCSPWLASETADACCEPEDWVDGLFAWRLERPKRTKPWAPTNQPQPGIWRPQR